MEDALIAVEQRAESFARELDYHRHVFPVEIFCSWAEVPEETQTHIVAFCKRYEMTQDQVVRKLFRSILAVRGVKLRTRALGEVIGAIADLGLVPNRAEWDELTKLRNALAHDYSLTPTELAPIINRAWTLSPRLIETVDRVKSYVTTHGLLLDRDSSDA